MKKIFLATLLAFLVGHTFGQVDSRVEGNQFKINFITPGLVNELGISKRSTLRVEVATFFGFNLFSSSDSKDNFAVFPVYDGQYRYYHNLQRRSLSGKNVTGNSADFFGFQANYISPNPLFGKFQPNFWDIIILGNLAGFEIIFFGPTYGFQRTFTSGLNVELQFSVGYLSINQKSTREESNNIYKGIGPNLSFGVGWVIGNKKKL